MNISKLRISEIKNFGILKLNFNIKIKMGIKNLFKLFHAGKTIRDLAEELDSSKLKGKKICIDASWQIYSSYNASNKFLQSEEKNYSEDNKFLFFMINVIAKYKNLGVDQLWIFDNPESTSSKEKEMQKREERRKKEEEKGNSVFVLNAHYVQLAQTLLGFLKIRYLTVPKNWEAEAYGSLLCHKGECCGVVSGDSDVLAFGGNLIRKEGTTWKFFNLKLILKEFSLTQEEFVIICVALGSDFAEKTRLVGPKTAIKKLKAGKIKLTEEQKVAYEMFLNKNIPDVEIIMPSEKNSVEELKTFLKNNELDTINIQNKIHLILN